MPFSLTRRRLLAGGIAGGLAVLAVPSVREYIDLLAPGSGGVWGDLGPAPSGTIDGPYGDATVRYDEEGVPHIEADDERALQYAHGYVQGYDRLFQLDLFRRQLRGTLSAVAGEVTVESDEFHRRLAFERAAEANAAAISGTETASILEAYVAGINAAKTDLTAPIETSLLEYDIDSWTMTDSFLIEKLMAWELTGSFRTLRRAALADTFSPSIADDLYPSRYDHDVPVLPGGRDAIMDRSSPNWGPPPAAVNWLSSFEPPAGQGSNCWVVSGEHTASGGPILANDPHLSLMAPPIWYEVSLETPSFATRGVTFPGTPFVVIGRSRHAAWGFTNVPADVMDFYSFEVDDEAYRIGDDWLAFETDEATISVAGGDDRTIERRFTNHGPYIDRHDAEVAIQWTGFGGTRTIAAIRDMQWVDGHDSLLEAVDQWDLPPQNFVYADIHGNTRYQLIGKIPIRRTDGEAVRGDQLFDGSAGVGRWDGFEPYTVPTWDGFIPLDELPHAVDPAVVSNANQRIVDDPLHYHAEIHATPYRAERLVDRLDAAVAEGLIDIESMIALQQDIHDALAEAVSPELAEMADTADLDAVHEALDDWDYKMRTDAWAPLVFELWLDRFRTLAFTDPLEAAGLDDSYVPSDWILANLPADHDWFSTAGDRDALVTEALEWAASKAAEYDDFGSFQQTQIDHPFEVGFLSYPRYPMPGSTHTLKNFRRDPTIGPGWQQVIDLGSEAAYGRLAGGNIGRVLSPHYADQLTAWIEGNYKPLDWSPTETRRLEFRGTSS